jgi:hypothetical protein
MSRMFVLAADDAVFHSVPSLLGFTFDEGQYYIRKYHGPGLSSAEAHRVCEALEQGARRLADTECRGMA